MELATAAAAALRPEHGWRPAESATTRGAQDDGRRRRRRGRRKRQQCRDGAPADAELRRLRYPPQDDDPRAGAGTGTGE